MGLAALKELLPEEGTEAVEVGVLQAWCESTIKTVYKKMKTC